MDSDAIDVMGSFLGDCPFKPYGNSDSFSVSPNDDVIAYATQSREVQAQSVRMHIYIYQIPEISQFGLKDERNIHNQKNNTVQPQLCLTNGQRGIHAMPIFSPSGRFLAYLATESDIDYKGIMKITIYDFYTREQRILCKDWDSSPESLHWSSHASDKLFVIAEVFAQDRIFSIDVISGKRSQAFPLESSASSVKLLNSTTLIYLRSSFIDTPNIYAINWFDAETKALINEKKLTDVNHEAFSSLTYQLQTPNELEVASVDGSSIHCRFFPPAGNQPTQKASVPLVVWVHGGPESSWNNEWNDRWNPQIFAQAGFALLLPDIHGSTSYGSKFQKAILGNWSGIALDDVISARKKVLQNYEYLDENRTAAMGGSFGGYMMNLIQMQETLEKNPFVCIVCHDPVFDVAQSAFESDILFFIHEEHGSSAWTDRSAEDKHSPTKQSGLRLEKIHTPQLTFQGGRDFRCSRGQGFGAFTVLQRLGVKSRLVFFPSENHWVLNPANVIEWNNEALSWLKDNVEDKEQAENTMKRKLELLQSVL